MYIKQRRFEDAEPVASAAYQGYATRLGTDHADTRRAVERFAAQYATAGQPAKADLWRAKLKSK
jgi:hypothetical protein